MKNLLLIIGFCILAVKAEFARNQEPQNRGYATIYTKENKALLKKWKLENKNLVLDESAGTSRETIEWTQV